MFLTKKGINPLFISCVIISYNDRAGLDRTLRFAAAQRVPAGLSVEFIVVDDGSLFPPLDIIAKYRATVPQLTYTARTRDSFSCRALARNSGAELAAGEHIVFLDSGVMIPQDFIAAVADRLSSDSHQVLVHEVLGLNRIPEIDASPLDEASPHTFHEIAEPLRLHEHWADARAGIFETVGNDLNKLPAPWSLGWTAALSLSKACFVQAGEFDASITDWGSEDTDLCFRLFQNGVRFYAERKAYAVHYPHPADTTANERTNRLNRRLIHKKTGNLHTEIYPYYPDTLLNQAIHQWDRLVLTDLLPHYSDAAASALLAHAGSCSRSLLLGSDQIGFIQRLSPSALLVPHTADADRIQKHIPDLEILHLLGIDTPFESEAFDIAIITDYIRLYPPCLREPLLHELSRVAKQVLCIYNPDYVSDGLSAGLWPWWNMLDSPLDSYSLSPLEVRDSSIICEIIKKGRSYVN